jgi:co-chaperonin GroES (HSP10)
MIKPIADRVKVLIVKEKVINSSILDTSINKVYRKNLGEVIECGSNVKTLKVGDIIYFNSKKATYFNEGEDEYALLSEESADLIAS